MSSKETEVGVPKYGTCPATGGPADKPAKEVRSGLRGCVVALSATVKVTPFLPILNSWAVES